MPPAGGPNALEVDIRAKTFRGADGEDVRAIEAIAFSVAPASFATLIGPSGCGKTTTLRIILGLDREFSGSLKLPDSGGRVAAVFQEPRLLPWRTVDDNVRLVLSDEEADGDLDDLFEILGLAEMRSRYPAELSLGLARRVALARAFAIRPSLMVLDEPFVSLDEQTATRLRALLTNVWSARPTTAVMVTHNLREAVELSDRIIFLTERPARVRGVYEIDKPRAERDSRWREATLTSIAKRYSGIL
ncbi:ATP-binding cassette domain-containing protein [Jiella sp. KSK16Y-1]|uniref:ATP-binding cassette domain-containing protein n=1 Tax=Jiella mangrovi TaxID=2821407 RepID=A0ABS4BIM6_9HYPH|nr:ATP-binding cassette domain-containing protein [Jiella mangrovi]